MATPNSWADIRNADIARIRQARGVPLPANFDQTSQLMNLSREDVEYIARLRGREYNPRFSPMTNLRGDDIDFIRQMAPQGVSQPQQFTNSGSPYAGGPYWTQQQFTNEGSPYMGQPMGQPAAPVLDAVAGRRNDGILNRLEAAQRAKQYPGLNRGLDPSLPGFDASAGPINDPTGYDTLLGAPGKPALSTRSMSQSDIDSYNDANKPRVEEGILQRVARKMTGGPAPASASAPTTPEPQKQNTQTADPVADLIMGLNDTRGMENGYGSFPQPQAMDTRGMENGYGTVPAVMDTRSAENGIGGLAPRKPTGGGFQLSEANGGGVLSSAPTPPSRPGGTPALYTVDFGDGSPVRQYMAQDGKAPNIPGANVMLDTSFDPNAGALARFIRGAF